MSQSPHEPQPPQQPQAPQNPQPPQNPQLPGQQGVNSAPQAPYEPQAAPGYPQNASDPYAVGGGSAYAAPGGQQQAPYGQMPGASLPISDNDRTLAILAHLSIVIASLISVGLLAWVGPLIIYLMTARDRPFPRQAAAGALNFAITVFIGQAIAGGLIFIGTLLMIVIIGFIPLIIGFIMAFVLWIWAIVVPILAAMAASRNEAYTYPLTPKIIK